MQAHRTIHCLRLTTSHSVRLRSKLRRRWLMDIYDLIDFVDAGDVSAVLRNVGEEALSLLAEEITWDCDE